MERVYQDTFQHDDFIEPERAREILEEERNLIMTEAEFNPKTYLAWFDLTKKYIQQTDSSYLGWFDADLTLLLAMVKMKSIGAVFDKDSFLADRFNRDGTLKED
jgi:hypothetical protein